MSNACNLPHFVTEHKNTRHMMFAFALLNLVLLQMAFVLDKSEKVSFRSLLLPPLYANSVTRLTILFPTRPTRSSHLSIYGK